MSVLVEIVACSVDDAVAAEQGGADRIELCAALGQGGLSPSPGLFRSVKAHCGLPAMVMIRPRAAGFCYTDLEFDSMIRDLEWFAESGADGFVTGCLRADGSLDHERNADLVKRANGLPVVCHRCFDVVSNPRKALEGLIELGFARVLTSGRRPTAMEGADNIRQFREQANGRIEILPGGGIRAADVAELLRRTGCDQIHLAPLRHQADPSTSGNPEIYFAGSLTSDEGKFDIVDLAEVRATVAAAKHGPGG